LYLCFLVGWTLKETTLRWFCYVFKILSQGNKHLHPQAFCEDRPA